MLSDRLNLDCGKGQAKSFFLALAPRADKRQFAIDQSYDTVRLLKQHDKTAAKQDWLSIFLTLLLDEN